MNVERTLTGAAAAVRRWDVAVVGAGPAGAVLARQVALHGLRVLLIDRQEFPRLKVCGGCLNAASLERLNDLGLGDVVPSLGGIELRRFHLAGWGIRATLDLPGGASLSRAALDAELLRRAIAAGADFLPGFAATLGEVSEEGRQLVLSSTGRTIFLSAAVVVAADGLAGGLLRRGLGDAPQPRGAPRIGVSAIAAGGSSILPGAIYMAVGRDGYVGLVRLEDGRLNVAAALDPSGLRDQRPAELVGHIVAQSGFEPLNGLEDAEWKGTKALRSRPRRVAHERLFGVGDAAGYVEPFTGEGVQCALDSAAFLAPLVTRAAASWQPQLVDEWQQRHAAESRGSQRLCTVLSGALRHPQAVRLALRLLALYPSLGAPVVQRVSGVGPTVDMVPS